MLSLSLGSFAFTAFINLVCVYACRGIQKQEQAKGNGAQICALPEEKGVILSCLKRVSGQYDGSSQYQG